MISSDDLLQRKKFNVDDMNYKTHDRDNTRPVNYNTVANDNENDRPSNSMLTQTLVLPYSDIRPAPNTIQPNAANNEQSSQNEQSHRAPNLNDQDVDHRFSSEEDENNRSDNNNRSDDKEEVKVNIKNTSNLFERTPQKSENPYLDRTQNLEKNDKSNSESKGKSEVDELHEFMNECKEELKSVGEVVRNYTP
jgi:hypothetical protein